MSENDITQEMWIIELENEYEQSEKNILADDTQASAYWSDVHSHLYGALLAISVPDDLLPIAYHRDIFKEVAVIWAHEASAGDSVIDKPTLAVECTNQWLQDVRSEHRKGLLYDRFLAEYSEFIAEERLKTSDEIIEDAWKITCYDDLLSLVESYEFDMMYVDALLTMQSPLFSVYNEVLGIDPGDIMEDLRDSLESVGYKRSEELMFPSCYFVPETKKYVDEFTTLYSRAEYNVSSKNSHLMVFEENEGFKP